MNRVNFIETINYSFGKDVWLDLLINTITIR
jgi:hypothetical protein